MARSFPCATETVDSSDDAATDQVMPNTIGKDASGELSCAAICIGQPVSQFQSSALSLRDLGLLIADGAQETAWNLISHTIELSCEPDKFVGGFLAIARNHRSSWHTWRITTCGFQIR